MKLLYVRPYEGEEQLVATALVGHEVVTCTCVFDMSPEERADIEILSVFVNYQVTKDVLDALPSVRFIATRSAGYDHLDMTAIRERGIVVSRVPHYGTRTVAEFAFALMFALSRNVHKAHADIQKVSTIGPLDAYEGFDLARKTLGVIGTGAIGANVCHIAYGLGMNVVAFDATPKDELVEKFGVRYAPIEEVLSVADIVTLHIPSLPETYHLIDAEKIALMKPTAYLINTARGEVVDTLALVAALRDGGIAGAGLDVLEHEHDLRDELALLSANETKATAWQTIVADHSLIDMPNVIVTPHIAFNTKEAKREITDCTIANITAFVAGAPTNTI